MRRFSITVEWGKVPDDPPHPPVDLDALVERGDPYRHGSHELDHRPIGFRHEEPQP